MSVWKAPAEELEVVRDDEERAGRDEREEPQVNAIAPKMPIPTAPAIDATASATGRSGMRVPSGRPRSSSSAWAPMPTASEERGERQRRARPGNGGASAAPIAT